MICYLMITNKMVDRITLISSEGDSFIIDKKLAERSGLLLTSLSDRWSNDKTDNNNQIKLKNIPSLTLKLVIDVLERKYSNLIVSRGLGLDEIEELIKILDYFQINVPKNIQTLYDDILKFKNYDYTNASVKKAIMEYDPDMLEYLVEQNQDITKFSEEFVYDYVTFTSPLLLALYIYENETGYYEHDMPNETKRKYLLEIMRILIRNGADVNYYDPKQILPISYRDSKEIGTPLMMLARTMNHSILDSRHVRLLLENGANLNHDTKGYNNDHPRYKYYNEYPKMLSIQNSILLNIILDRNHTLPIILIKYGAKIYPDEKEEAIKFLNCKKIKYNNPKNNEYIGLYKKYLICITHLLEAIEEM